MSRALRGLQSRCSLTLCVSVSFTLVLRTSNGSHRAGVEGGETYWPLCRLLVVTGLLIGKKNPWLSSESTLDVQGAVGFEFGDSECGQLGREG